MKSFKSFVVRLQPPWTVDNGRWTQDSKIRADTTKELRYFIIMAADAIDANAISDIVRQAVHGINVNKRRQTLEIQQGETASQQLLALTNSDTFDPLSIYYNIIRL
jgi:uncharacterized protein YjdB